MNISRPSYAAFTKPAVAIATLAGTGVVASVAVDKAASKGDWAHPSEYGNAVALAGGVAGVAAGVLGTKGLGLAKAARALEAPVASTGRQSKAALEKAATFARDRESAFGQAALYNLTATGVVAGGAIGVMKSHSQVEKSTTTVRVEGDLNNTYSLIPKEAGDIADGAGGAIGNILDGRMPWDD